MRDFMNSTKRRKFIAGNWKLNPADEQGCLDLLRQLKSRLEPFSRVETAVCPPFTALHWAAQILKETRIRWGAQDLFWEDTGAFTGEVSAPMLKAVGCRYVIVGHSERRQYFGEKDEDVRRKAKAALRHSLTPIICVGETLEQREARMHREIVSGQMREAVSGLTEAELASVVIAYEPVWAIGTGKTATPEQAQEMHAYIRSILSEMYNRAAADQIQILYGGSVKPDNARDLLQQPDIDGALVGGASLKAGDFAEIVRAGEEIN
jgi:triosephosphate isomerase